MFSLGIDVGSSSVKVALLDIESGKCVCSSTNPKVEAPIIAERLGRAGPSVLVEVSLRRCQGYGYQV